jgi:5-(carboxyamino)imidazole ribonucleotide synthase
LIGGCKDTFFDAYYRQRKVNTTGNFVNNLAHTSESAYICIMARNWYGKDFRLGMIGGGQLGRMFIQEAINMDVQVHVLDPDPEAPCSHIASSFTVGKLTEFDILYNFGKDKDLLTVEIENINVEALEYLEKEGVKIFPEPRVLRIIRDKGIQKEFYQKAGIPTAPFRLIQNRSDLDGQTYPVVQKLRTGGYDGKGVQILQSEQDIEKSFDEPSVLEDLIPFEKELSVIVARNESGETVSFPAVECYFNPEANLVELLFSPADISPEIEEEAQALARSVIDALNMTGLLAVEMFLTHNGQLLVNEIAPRPHNSGHHTIECNVTSQFEQHMRSILNLPLGSTDTVRAGAMVNLLGEKGFEGPVHYQGLEEVLALEGVHPHLYGKSNTKPFRKMGHVTISGKSTSEVLDKAKKVLGTIKVISK